MNIDLSGMVGIVTGAGGGIGQAIATRLATEGVTVVSIDVNEKLLAELGKHFDSLGCNHLEIICDVSNSSDVAEAIKRTVASFGKIDVLVNSAGVTDISSVEDQDENRWDFVQNVNLKGTMLMCREVIPVMKKARSGRIINAASFAAIIPAIAQSAYAASKAGVVQFTRVLAGELGPWNITANTYAPGMVPTTLNHFTEQPEEVQKNLLNTLTLQRWGGKEDIANLICFLASKEAGYITGSLIDISGGKFATQIPSMAYEGID